MRKNIIEAGFFEPAFSYITPIVAVFIAATSLFVPNLYNTEPEVKALAAQFIIVYAFYSTIQGYIFVSYNTLRSGGKTFITFLFDSGFVCCVDLIKVVLVPCL